MSLSIIKQEVIFDNLCLYFTKKKCDLRTIEIKESILADYDTENYVKKL